MPYNPKVHDDNYYLLIAILAVLIGAAVVGAWIGIDHAVSENRERKEFEEQCQADLYFNQEGRDPDCP